MVDTNVLVDVVSEDTSWLGWSLAQLGRAAARGPLLVNDIVYAELSARLDDWQACDAFLLRTGIRMDATPREALFLAGRAHLAYRRRGGPRHGVLSDFFIGAHALVRGWPVLTRDPARYRTAFPMVRLITP